MPQNPPTTSGVVIISGSYGFAPGTSDFPVELGRIVTIGHEYVSNPPAVPVFRAIDTLPLVSISGLPNYDIYPYPATIVTLGHDYLTYPVVSSPFNSIDFVFPDDHYIETTPTATSGICIWSFYPGAGVGFVVPLVINARLFPIFAGIYPEQDRRIYPVLPQYSTIVIP